MRGGCGPDGGSDEHSDGHSDDGRSAGVCRLTPSRWTDAERVALGKECNAIANLLVTADEVLAKVALSDAIETPIQNPKHAKQVQHEIEKTRREIANAREEWSEGDYGDAIERFDDAWEHAERAIREARRR